MKQGIYAKALANLSKLLFTIKNEEHMKGFLEDMLTPQEVIEIDERIALCRQLLQGKTQREIAEKLGISITTVNRGSRILKFGTGTAAELLQ